MLIKYISYDGSIVTEKVSQIEFTDGVELACQRAKDNPCYDPNDHFKGKFYLETLQVKWVRRNEECQK